MSIVATTNGQLYLPSTLGGKSIFGFDGHTTLTEKDFAIAKPESAEHCIHREEFSKYRVYKATVQRYYLTPHLFSCEPDGASDAKTHSRCAYKPTLGENLLATVAIILLAPVALPFYALQGIACCAVYLIAEVYYHYHYGHDAEGPKIRGEMYDDFRDQYKKMLTMLEVLIRRRSELTKETTLASATNESELADQLNDAINSFLGYTTNATNATNAFEPTASGPCFDKYFLNEYPKLLTQCHAQSKKCGETCLGVLRNMSNLSDDELSKIPLNFLQDNHQTLRESEYYPKYRKLYCKGCCPICNTTVAKKIPSAPRACLVSITPCKLIAIILCGILTGGKHFFSLRIEFVYLIHRLSNFISRSDDDKLIHVTKKVHYDEQAFNFRPPESKAMNTEEHLMRFTNKAS